MKLRVMDVDREILVNCIFCGIVSHSIECETMFEVEHSDRYDESKTINYICSDCLHEIDQSIRILRVEELIEKKHQFDKKEKL